MSHVAETPMSIAEILDEHFNALRSTNKAAPRTAVEQAAFLNISAGYMSKIRNGKVHLSSELAAKIAQLLSLGDSDKKAAIEKALMAVRNTNAPDDTPTSASDISPDAIIDFFDRIACKDSLLCVDYRDFPQALKAGPFPKTAEEAAEAVFNGLSFAMFQPFGSVEILKESLKAILDTAEPSHMASGVRLQYYLLELASRVREVHQEIREEIKSVSRREGKPAAGRLVLYEAEVKPLRFIGCGIQSRVFYADYVMDKRHYCEVYEWVAGAENHYFIRRSNDSLNVEAVREQFHPITTRWMDRRGHGIQPMLPQTKAELDKVYEEVHKGGHRRERHWTVWEP